MSIVDKAKQNVEKFYDASLAAYRWIGKSRAPPDKANVSNKYLLGTQRLAWKWTPFVTRVLCKAKRELDGFIEV